MVARGHIWAAWMLVIGLGATARAAVLVSAATDRAQYNPGQALDISVTAQNTDSQPVTLNFPSTLQSQYILDSAYIAPTVGLGILTQRMIPANSSYTWTYRHDWRAYNLALGGHNALGRVIGVGDSAGAAFQVVAPVLPTSNFVVNFDTLPGSATAISDVSEYWPYGVHFGTMSGNPAHKPTIFSGGPSGRFLEITETTYPPGLNLFAKLDMGVFGMGAQVSAGSGVTVTMIAKGANGQVLDTQTSQPVPTPLQFLPLSVHSNQPIASVEWWPSNPQSGVMLDNVSIALPEPAFVGGLMLVGGAACLRRRWGKRLP